MRGLFEGAVYSKDANYSRKYGRYYSSDIISRHIATHNSLAPPKTTKFVVGGTQFKIRVGGRLVMVWLSHTVFTIDMA